MLLGDVKAEVMDENKWVNMDLNGTTHALLTINRPVRIEAYVGPDLSLVILLFDGIIKKDGEQPIAQLGISQKPDNNWISHADGSVTIIPRK